MALKRIPEPEVEPVEEEVPRAITAATATVILSKSSAWATWRFGNRDWQIESWRLYDIIGELRFLAAWIGDSVSQCRMYVTKVDETGEETGEIDDPKLAEMAALPLGVGSQRDDNLRLLGINLAVAGEAWIVGENAVTKKPENWFVLSGGQIRREGGIITVRRPLQAGGEILKLTDGKDLLIRVWRPHPNDIFQSDSPTRSAIPPLREIELLTKREFAELESRLTGAGVWFLPEGIAFPAGTGEPEGIQGFYSYMQEVFSENIRDQSRASALVPITVTIPDHLLEHMDKLRPINFWSELSSHILEMKKAAIARVASAFEIPSELLAMGDSNHWTAWAIGEEGIKRIKPYLSTIADTLTRGFLVPKLKKQGIEDAERYAYVFDVSPLAVRPNQLQDAIQLHDRLLLSDKATVHAGAFGEEQMPTEQERIKMLLFHAVTNTPSLLTDPAIQSALGIGQGGIPRQRPPAEDGPRALPAKDEDRPADGPPDTADEDRTDKKPPGPDASAAINRAAFAKLVAIACDMTVLRALELAASRLATRADRSGRWGHVPRHEIHTKVESVSVESAEKAIGGAWAHVPRLAAKLNVDGDALYKTLHSYCLGLITGGIAHDDVLLANALNRDLP